MATAKQFLWTPAYGEESRYTPPGQFGFARSAHCHIAFKMEVEKVSQIFLRKALVYSSRNCQITGVGMDACLLKSFTPATAIGIKRQVFYYIIFKLFSGSRMQRHYIDYAVMCSNNILNIRCNVLEGYTRIHLFGFSLICIYKTVS